MVFKSSLIPSRLERWTEEGRIRPEIAERIQSGHHVTLSEFSEMRVNSYEQHLLFPLFDDYALIETAQHTLANCSRGDTPPATYNEAMCNVIGPRLLDRFRNVLSNPDEASERSCAGRGATASVAREALEEIASWDEGYLPSYGGGNVEWWQDAIRGIISRIRRRAEEALADLDAEETERDEQRARTREA